MMSWWKLVARVLIVGGAVLWIRAAMSMETPGQLPSKQKSGQLGLAFIGCVVAWEAWRRLDGERAPRRGRDAHGRPMFGGPLGDVPPPRNARLNLELGACPACGSTKSPAVTRGPDGRVRARCRDCGLVGTPPSAGV